MPGAPIQYPLVNGKRHSFASIEFNFNGQIYTGFKEIKYGRKHSTKKIWGTHKDPIGKTQGQNDYEASIEMYLWEWDTMQVTLGPGYGELPLVITVTYNEIGVSVVTDILLGCNIGSTEAQNQEGTDPSTRKIELDPVKILFNGVDDCLVPLIAANV